ncbi:MAG TPA: YolD-like family protein [Firmicutes bacterium]|nr:YolD-like family protein [Bacillota bacterium]
MRPKIYNRFVCSSFMLPEHVESLDEYHTGEQQKEAEYVPEVDEQELEIWGYLIRQSLNKGHKITITCLTNSGRDTLTGVVWDARNSILYVRDEITGKKKTVALDKIFSVEEG